MKFEIYKSKGEWRWRLRAANGEIIAHGQGYVRKIDCKHAVELVQESATASVEFVLEKADPTPEVL